MMAMGILGPLATAPQLDKLYFTHSQHAGGLSLSMWVSVLASLWIIYGLVHKAPPIWLGNVIGHVMDVAMVVGILIHAGLAY